MRTKVVSDRLTMKALAFAATLSLTISWEAFAQDSKLLVEPNGASKQPAEVAANIDVAAIQKKITELTEAIKREPKNDAFYGARGDGYQRLGKLDLSIKDLSRAIELNPKRQAYYELRAFIYGRQKRYHDSYVDYSKAIECGPQTHYLVLKQGQAAALAEDFKTALNSARIADGLKKDDVKTLTLLGAAEQKLGLLVDSLKHLTKAIELDASAGGVMLIRADTYSLMGKKDLAKRDEENARKLGFQH